MYYLKRILFVIRSSCNSSYYMDKHTAARLWKREISYTISLALVEESTNRAKKELVLFVF